MNGPSLMSNCLLIILVISSCVIFGGFPCRFRKAVSTVLLFLVGLQLSVLLWLSSFFYSLRLLFARLS